MSELGRLAANRLMDALRAGQIAPGLPTSVLYGADGGKMFGTLAVRNPEGRVGVLKAFSGQLEHTWDVEGFVPPVFDRVARLAVEPRGEASVRAFTARVLAARNSAEWAAARVAKMELEARHTREEAALDARHASNRAARHDERSRRGVGESRSDLAARADEVEHRAMKSRFRSERVPLDAVLARFGRRLRRIEELRVAASRIVSRQLYETYAFENRLGERMTLRELFAPGEPPSGAGDCAAPKLLVFALRHRLEPLALAEFWWGNAPRGLGREEGTFYPPCAEKCATVLPFLLRGCTLVV